MDSNQLTSHALKEQEAVPLVSRLADGSYHIAAEFAPVLMRGLAQKTAPQAPALVSNNVEPFPATSEEATQKNNSYETQRRANFQNGRIWSSMTRRLMREEDITRYEAFQDIAEITGKPVTDIKRLVEFNNKQVKVRGKAIRQAIVWKWFCEGLNHQQIANLFPFKLHSKTVASDLKEIKQQQYGGTQNVR